MEANMNRIPKAVYTKELREEAVKLAMTGGVGLSEAARRLSISMKTLANWTRAAKARKLESVGQHQKPLTEMEAELGRVKRELTEVKMERDVLKNSRRPLRRLFRRKAIGLNRGNTIAKCTSAETRWNVCFATSKAFAASFPTSTNWT
jgi:transposase-like protein